MNDALQYAVDAFNAKTFTLGVENIQNSPLCVDMLLCHNRCKTNCD